MERGLNLIWAEGRSIAKNLGNGVRYAGPQMEEGGVEFHLFNDDDITGGSFAALSLKGAKKELLKLRKRFGAQPPIFKKGP